MAPKVELKDPADLFFGLHDLAERVRTLGPGEHREWTRIISYINSYIEYLSSLTSDSERPERPLTGGREQRIMIALHALEAARRSAERRATNSTADAVEQASK